MAEWTFRVLSEPFTLDPDEQQAVVAEIARLRALIRDAPDTSTARVNRNPGGLVGEYTSLLIEATVRGRAVEDVVPADVRRRYGRCHWFGVSLEVLTAFAEEWAAVRAEDANPAPVHRRLPG